MFRARVIQLACPPIQVIRPPTPDKDARLGSSMHQPRTEREYCSHPKPPNHGDTYRAYSCPSDPSATVIRRSPRVAGPTSTAPVLPLNSEPWHGQTNRTRRWS